MNWTSKAAAWWIVLLIGAWLGPGWAGGQEQANERAGKVLGLSGLSGGLIVHLGCGDGRLTAAWGRSGRFLVQGLDRDPAAVVEARRQILAQGGYGRTSVRQLRSDRLPYINNLVNLLVVDDPLGTDRDEWLRVLAPRGVLLVRQGDTWQKEVKPWPEGIDEWTHFLHGPDNNAVARDRVVGPPARVQWVADPRHLRSHEHLNSVSAVVSARGRVFAVIDEGPTSAVVAPPRWRLVARDAFNGILLWKHDLGPWEGHFRLFRSGPPEIARRLVAVGDRVYVTLGYGKRVAAFDAATGETVRTYEATGGAVEIIASDGCLFVVTGTIDPEAWRKAAERFYPTPPPRHKKIVAVDADSGQLLWKRADEDTDAIMPATMAVAEGRVFFENTRQIVCLDAASGSVLWRAERPAYTTRLSWSAPTLVVCHGIVLSADGSTGGLPAEARRGQPDVTWIMSDRDIRKHPVGELVALDAETGKRLWTGTSLQGFCSPGDVFVIGDRVWCGANVSTGQAMLDAAVNLKTGELESRASSVPPVGGHTRCYRNKATERFLVLGSIGVEFVDVNDWTWSANPWVRGTCQYGVMPSNGLLYVPPDSCACRPNVRLHGFTAMAPAPESGGESRESPVAAGGEEALERGPAFDLALDRGPATPDDRSTWPAYRNDAARSGWTRAAVATELRPAWQTPLGGRLSALTVGPDHVYVAQIDAHTVCALDRQSGRIAWSRTVDGPVDSPPAVASGRVLFGSHDGCVWCLRAGDGELVWRFRAAPEQRFLVAREQVESAWPVHGSVLVRGDLVWFVAGRSSYLDSGLYLYALKVASGEPVVSRRLDGRDAEPWKAVTAGPYRAVRNRLPGTRPDILSASGDRVFMGWTSFDGQGRLAQDLEPHLFSATGFLDDTWWHRTYWQYGTWMRGGFGGWPQAARQVPAGRILVVTDETIFGFGRQQYDVGNPEGTHAGHVGVIKDTYQDSGRVDHSQNPYRLFAAPRPAADTVNRRHPQAIRYRWQAPVPILVRAMVGAGDVLWIGGPNTKAENRGLAEIATLQPGQLQAVSASEGKVLASYPLDAAPVFDGLAAVSGRLYLSAMDGTVRCFADR